MTWDTLRKCLADEEGGADRIDLRLLRQRFLCADNFWPFATPDDLLSLAEFGSLLAVAAGGAGEALIEALALATPTTDAEELDTFCARVYLDADADRDRVLSRRETKESFLAYANTGLAQTAGEKLA